MQSIRSRLKSVSQFKGRGQVVLVRVDYNAETGGGRVLDDTRIIASLPTLKHLIGLESKIIIISHRGRPHGIDEKLSLKPMARHLADLLNTKFVEMPDKNLIFPSYPTSHIIFTNHNIADFTKQQITSSLKGGDILFFENIRFYNEEEEKSVKFAKKLASLADVFVNEAFSVCHHASSSTTILPTLLPKYGGLRLLEEIQVLDSVVKHRKRPFVLIAGGAKISDKASMLKNLLSKCDKVLLGGAMANLFFYVSGYEVGQSKMEKEARFTAQELMRNYKDILLLPKDVVVGTSLDSSGRVVPAEHVGKSDYILDIGPQTILEYSEIIKTAATIIWNGPLGFFEKKQFANGSLALARLIASRAKTKTFVLAGGGETSQILKQIQMHSYIDYFSTGGGAMLSYLGNEKMPGLEALSQ